MGHDGGYIQDVICLSEDEPVGGDTVYDPVILLQYSRPVERTNCRADHDGGFLYLQQPFSCDMFYCCHGVQGDCL